MNNENGVMITIRGPDAVSFKLECVHLFFKKRWAGPSFTGPAQITLCFVSITVALQYNETSLFGAFDVGCVALYLV